MNSKSKVDFPMIKNNDFLICLHIIYYLFIYLFIYLNLRKGEIQCLTVNKLFTVMVQGTHESIYTYLKV